MADDETGEDELETQEGAPLPPREMMSLISTDPADPLVGVGGLEPGPMPTPPSGTEPTPHVPPIGGDEMHTMDDDTQSSEPRSETIHQSDSASSET